MEKSMLKKAVKEIRPVIRKHFGNHGLSLSEIEFKKFKRSYDFLVIYLNKLEFDILKETIMYPGDLTPKQCVKLLLTRARNDYYHDLKYTIIYDHIYLKEFYGYIVKFLFDMTA